MNFNSEKLKAKISIGMECGHHHNLSTKKDFISIADAGRKNE